MARPIINGTAAADKPKLSREEMNQRMAEGRARAKLAREQAASRDPEDVLARHLEERADQLQAEKRDANRRAAAAEPPLAETVAATSEAEMQRLREQMKRELLAEVRAELRAEMKPGSGPKRAIPRISAEARAAEEFKRLTKLEAMDLRMQAEHAASGRGGVPPLNSLSLPKRHDPTELPKKRKVRGYDPERHIGRWIPETDKNGAATDEPWMCHERNNAGFEFGVWDDDGTPVKSPFGRWMFGDAVEAEAPFAFSRRPAGAVHPEDYYATEVETEMDYSNSRMQSGMAGTVTRDGAHGMKRSYHGPSGRELNSAGDRG